MREICFDTETTGFDPLEGDRIFEIGCVELIDKKTTGNTFNVLLNPERELSESSIEITGFTDADLVGKPFFKDVVQEFLDFIGDAQLIAHNANFDMKFINFELEKAGFEVLSYERVTDSLAIAKDKYPGQKNNLNALCKRLEVDLSARTKHGALLDAELLAEAYIRMILGCGQSSMFGGEKAIEGDSNSFSDITNEERKVLEARDFPVDSNVLDMHKAFIKKSVKGSGWYIS
jgi:DNA polymerase-3 subunit epsilon